VNEFEFETVIAIGCWLRLDFDNFNAMLGKFEAVAFKLMSNLLPEFESCYLSEVVFVSLLELVLLELESVWVGCASSLLY